MKEFFSKKKNIIICAICAILVIAAIVAIVIVIINNSNNEEKRINNELEAAGRKFYEEFYYSQIGTNDSERAEFLSKYSAIGIKIDLENLARTTGDQNELLSKFVNKKTNQECNKTNTKVTIYPKDPYGQKDYTIEKTVDCGFNDKK